MDRVDKKVFSHFDIIASFFVDVFFNDLYLKAIDLADSGKSPSITDGYKRLVAGAYPKAISIRDHYRQVIIRMHGYYCAHTARNMGFADFEKQILEQFIPKKYLHDYRDAERENTLHKIVVDCVNDFARFMIAPENVRKVIDLRDCPEFEADIETMKEHIRRYLLTVRDSFYERFIHENTVETVPKSLLDKTQAIAVEQIRERDKIIADLRAEREDIAKSLDEIKRLKNIAGQLYTELTDTKKDLSTAKQDRERLVRIIQQLVAKAQETTSAKGCSRGKVIAGADDSASDDTIDDTNGDTNGDINDSANDTRDDTTRGDLISFQDDKEISEQEFKEMQKMRRQEMLSLIGKRPQSQSQLQSESHSQTEPPAQEIVAPEVIIDESSFLLGDEPLFGN